MPVIAVSNQKGGVGKTTTTLNLAAALQEVGKRVLMVDLDPQGSLTLACGLLEIDSVRLSIGDLLIAHAEGHSANAREAIVTTPVGLDIIPGNGMLGPAELALGPTADRESALAKLLLPTFENYDYVLIDCLPSLGLIAINALRAATGVVIPVSAEFLAVHGLGQVLETVCAVRRTINPKLQIYGVVLTMVDARQSHARRVVATVRDSLKNDVPIFDTEVAYDITYKDATEAGKSVLQVDSGSRAAETYRTLAFEVMLAAGEKPAAALYPRRRGVVQRLIQGMTRAA